MRYARSGSWTDRCPRTVSGYPSRASRERRKEPKRPGARGVDVRKGKLLAGDSGRKIAEVIDLRGAIYQRGSREDGRGAPGANVVCELLSCTRTNTRFCVRITGKGKRGRVFVRLAKCTTIARGMGTEAMKSRERATRIGDVVVVVVVEEMVRNLG